MTLRSQVAGGLAALLLLTAALTLYLLVQTRELHAANRQLATADLELSRASLRVRRHIDQLTGLTQRYVVLRDADYVGELERLRQEIEVEIRHLESLPLDDVGPIEALRELWSEYTRRAGDLERTVDAGGATDAMLEDLLNSIAQPRELVRRLDNAASERAAELIEAGAARAATARRVAMVTAIAGLILAAALAWWIGCSTAKPLRALTEGAEAMAAGDFDHRVEVSSPRELQRLAGDFNELASRLGELDRMKRDFVSSVSHDLKAPLASIEETTRLLLEDEAALSAEQRRFLELNASSAARLRGMIGDLLDMARLEADAVNFELEPLDLNDCCERAVEEADSVLASRGLEVSLDLAPGPLSIRADLALLLQALGNLLSNAARYSPEAGVIRLRTLDLRRQLSSLRVEIEDRGPGVPDDEKRRIFDRFYSSAGVGTGLGLAIARSVVDHHGGRVWVEDAALGGSVFLVELPENSESSSRPEESGPA